MIKNFGQYHLSSLCIAILMWTGNKELIILCIQDHHLECEQQPYNMCSVHRMGCEASSLVYSQNPVEYVIQARMCMWEPPRVNGAMVLMHFKDQSSL